MRHAAMLLGLLAACDAPRAPVPDDCGAAGYQALIGTPLAAVTLPADLNARIIPEGSAVTMEFAADRINFALDGEGRIERIFCG